jgi:hypothetical protein
VQVNRHVVAARTLLILSLLFTVSIAMAQDKSDDKDSFFLAKKKGWLGKIGQSISVNSGGLSDSAAFAAVKNIAPFILYKGSIIRKVNINKVAFGQSVNDTSHSSKNFFNEIAEKIHVSTSEKTIRNNLFFKAGDSLYPYLMADNERFLRDIPYLQDARIVARESVVDGINADSVDITIYYKDVFPISGNAIIDNPNLFMEGIDDNFRGNGDRLSVQTLYDLNRTPKMGFGTEYKKRNIKGSFIDFTVGYQNLYPAFNSGRREENTIYAKLELPLVSQYRLWTGAIEASSHFTQNDYLNDSLFLSDYNYNYKTIDTWLGYNISAKHLLHESGKGKTKTFLAIRGIKKDFTQVPLKYKTIYNYLYADESVVLASYTIFKQDYYRTSFIYGFGRNEDVPEGFNASFITGWTDKQQYVRPYIGFDIQKNFYSKKQHYFNYTFRAGSYFNDGKLQDISMLASVEAFSKLRKIQNSKWLVRHFLSGSFTEQINTFLNQPLLLNSIYGIPEFANPDTTASSRLTFNGQSVFYNTWKFFGFNFAPFTFASLCYLKPIGKSITQGDGYVSVGAGVRTRNENLVFGTIELKMFYFPRTTNGMSPFNISINSDLKFKYNSQFIKRPDFVPVN